MNCLECRELLQKRLDGEPIAGPALEEHLSRCQACREQHAGAMHLLEAVHAASNVKVPAGFADAVVAGVFRDRVQRRQRMQRRVFVTMALAASIVLVLLLTYYWLPRPESHQPQPKAPLAHREEKPAPQPKTPEDPKVEKKEPRNPVTALADRWVDNTRDHAKVVAVAASVDKLPPVELPVNPTVREASQDVSDGVRTVTRSARKAFDFFARELPMPEIGAEAN
jgi:hypothetical protein